jgi:hypothetical protein
LAPGGSTLSPDGSTPSPGGSTRSELRRRHEDLAEQVRELHWDLGGLAYEMAIRDHFRLDVLMRRAAILQERDAELAELERLLHAEDDGIAGSCPSCLAPHSRGAQYCWKCGAQLMESAAVASAAEPAGGSAGGASTLPSPRVSALLVLVFLAFGTILGGAAGSRVSDTLAAAPEKLLLPAAPTAQVQLASPPPSTPEASPEPTPAAEASPAKPAGKGAASGTKEASEEEAHQQSSEGSSGISTPAKSTVKHVFVIVLSSEPYASLFGPSAPPYLAHTLAAKGELLPRYYSVSHQALAGEIALISGQGPTPQTQANCPTFADVSPGLLGAEGQARGEGCVYPQAVETIADQLRAKRLSWRAYIQGLEEAPANLEPCAHPVAGQPDPTAQAQPTGPYATFRNPFVYFHSLIDTPSCQALDVGLGDLAGDLANPQGAPAFFYIAPDLCDDAAPAPCAPGAAAGPAAAEGFLKSVVPKILASSSYKEGGLIAITADEAPPTGELADSSSCCGQPRFPNLPQSAEEEASPNPLAPPGGGQVGALLLSPLIKGGTVEQEPADAYSLLRLFEDFFGLRHLGYAASSRLTALEASSLFANGG